MLRYFAIEDCVKYAHSSTGISNSLSKPDDLAVIMFFAHIQLSSTVLLDAVLFIRIGHWKHEEQSMDRTGHKSEEIRVGNAVDIVKCECGRKAKCLSVLCDDGRIGFKGNPFLSC